MRTLSIASDSEAISLDYEPELGLAEPPASNTRSSTTKSNVTYQPSFVKKRLKQSSTVLSIKGN